MYHLINLLADNPFLLRAMIACICISFICPILGVFLIFRRMSLMGDAIAHSILPGVALGFMLGSTSIVAMTIGGIIAGIIVSILAGFVSNHTSLKEDASFAGFYLIALALGVLIISMSGTNVDLIHILFGSILAVDKLSLIILATIVSISLITIAVIIRPLLIDVFDKNLLKYYGVNRGIYHAIFLFLVVINLVVEFHILGTLLVVGLMMLPAACGKLLAKNLNNMLLIAIIVSTISSCSGIIISYYGDFVTGPSIILVNGLFYILAVIWVQIKKIVIKPHYRT